tara:strand:+ start:1061 stop:2491 length:1431 start_codon:yes stop_codon:yes gene_type:complete
MANNAIIQAAGAAYKPVQGQYDLSGFINGITAVAAGVVKQGQIRKKMQSDLNKFYFPSANPQVQAVAEAIKAKVIDPKENFSVQEGINALKTLEYQVKTVLPKINTKFGDIDKKGLAGSVEPFAENYVNNIATGQLDQTIKIGNEAASAVYRVNPQTLGLEMMGIDGSFVTPELLYANLGNLPTLDTASKPTTKMIGYVDDKFAKGEKGSWKETSDGITNYFNNQIVPNKKVFLAFLSDNMDGFTITNKKNITEEISWYDHYMDQTMDENQKAIVQPILDDITDPEVLKRTKQIYMNQLMKGDKNLKKDFNSYLEKIKSAKDPGDIVEPPASFRTIKYADDGIFDDMKIDVSNYTKEEARQLSVAEVVINSVHSIKESDVASAKALQKYNLKNNTGLGIELVLGGKTKDGDQKVYYRKSMQGGEGAEVRISNEFVYYDLELIDELILPDLFNNTKGAPKFKTNVYNDIFNSLPSKN